MRARLHDEVPFPKSRVIFTAYTGLLMTIYIMYSLVSQAMIITV